MTQPPRYTRDDFEAMATTLDMAGLSLDGDTADKAAAMLRQAAGDRERWDALKALVTKQRDSCSELDSRRDAYGAVVVSNRVSPGSRHDRAPL